MRDIADLRLSNILLAVDDEGIARVTLNRPAKRNALDLATIEELIDIFTTLPRAGVRAAILDAAGDHFCAGLDLVEHHREDRSAADFMQVCLRWHDAFNRMEYGGVPVIAVLQGAVVGGGLELASGATIRVADLIGKARMIDMMLSGRLYRGAEAVSVGLCQYMVDDPAAHALQIARKAAQNPPLSNFAICSAISHMQNMSALDAAYAEAAVAGVVNTQAVARDRLAAFAGGTADKIKPV